MPPPPAKKFAFASSQSSSATANNLDGEGGPPLPLGRVAPKVVTIARPPRMLKVEHLTDPKRGIASLPRELIVEGGPPFKGKGHELEDLRLLLSRAKHWAHRLFPRITFEDFVERAEGLGSKRPLRNHLTRIRHGMPLSFGTTNEDGEVVGVNSEDEEDVVRVGDDNQGPAVDSSAAAEQEDNNNSSSTSELKFDRLFREFSSTIAAASSSTQRPPPPPPPRLTTTIEKVAEEEGEEGEEKKEEKAAQKAAEEGSVSEEITAGPPAQSQQQQQQSSTSSKQQQQEEEEFDMDDDDFDEDFLSSFKP